MSANLSPEYMAAEKAYKVAKDPDEKLLCLERMLQAIPKHKGTEKMQADIKRRIARSKAAAEKRGGKKGFGVKVERDYEEDLPCVEAHGGELNQVWTNIVDNAVIAMEGAGKLELKAYREDSRVVVEISDSGPGIPPEVREKVFDPFFTTKAPGEGTGLGLNISHNIVAQKRIARANGQTTRTAVVCISRDRQNTGRGLDLSVNQYIACRHKRHRLGPDHRAVDVHILARADHDAARCRVRCTR